MAKGRTTQPLVIAVYPPWATHAAIEELRVAGHSIISTDQPWIGSSPDLILHPAAHGWNDFMWEYLPAALTAARRRRKERK